MLKYCNFYEFGNITSVHNLILFHFEQTHFVGMSLLPEFQVLVCLTRSGVVIDGFAGSCHTGVFSCMEKESVFLLLYTSVISLLTLLIAEMFFLQFLLFQQEFSVRERRTVWIKGFLSMHLYVCPHMFEV